MQEQKKKKKKNKKNLGQKIKKALDSMIEVKKAKIFDTLTEQNFISGSVTIDSSEATNTK